ncbi:MAG: hypothetical protein LBO00_09135 [Zoogloeaceae bacterium]|jgi:hypothetical protein|nr:hypothetical protein [Zoogloeaceae bacterium]
MSDKITVAPTLLGKRQALLLTNWLSSAPETLKAEEVSPQLGALLGLELPPSQKLYLLEEMFLRFERCLEEQASQFVDVRIPLRPAIYRKVNLLLDVIGDFALGYEGILNALAAGAPEDDLRLCLERTIFCLRAHLYVGYLVGCPASLGIWQRLHGAFLRSWQSTPNATLAPYTEALLLATAKPATCTAREIACIASYARQHAHLAQITEIMPKHPEGVFWIPLQQDFHAFPLNRRTPPPGARVLYFSGYDIVTQTQIYLDDILQERARPEILELVNSPQDGVHILEHLIANWGRPGQRRFPRHRKSYRGMLCMGLSQIHAALKQPELSPDLGLSQWIITNESPDGYTLMFLSGVADPIDVGEIITLLPNAPQAQAPQGITQRPVGIIRWVQSETPEHIEIGVQVLAPAATPAILSIQNVERQVEVLVLPGPPALPSASILVTPTGIVTEQNRGGILLAREGKPPCMVYVLTMREQNRHVEAFMIAEATPFPERTQAAGPR